MRKIIIVLSSCIVLLLVGFTGYRSYLVWKQSHGLSMAKACFAKADSRNAFLSLQQVLKTNPRNIEAARMMAALMEAEHLPGAFNWRQRVVQLDPGSFKDRLALAQIAIVQQNYSLATNALADIAEADKKTPAFHNLAGTLALMQGRSAEAEAHFSECIRLEPDNDAPKVNLAVVRLHRTNSLDLAEARLALQRVIATSTNTALCGQARRELILDALRNQDNPTALKFAQELAQPPNGPFGDKILRLDVLKKLQSPELPKALAVYQAEAVTDPGKISALANWQTANSSPEATLAWLQHLPAPLHTNVTVEVLVANCQLQLNDWHALQTALQPQNWNDTAHPWSNFEFMRHAYLARCLRGEGFQEASSAEWAVALKSTGDQKNPLLQKADLKMLFELTAAWNWNSETEQVLWTVVNQFPEEKWAFPVLREALVRWHRTRSLVQLLDIMLKRDPDNLNLKNDLAATAMLVGAQELKPYELARQVYDKSPTNSIFASTCAFALYLQGKPADALKIMQKVNPKDLEEPSIGAYYGLILKANGNPAEAKVYLNKASRAQWLPEEDTLFAQAKAGL